MLKGVLKDENDDVEDKYFFHDDWYIKLAAWGKLEDRLACVVELKDENFWKTLCHRLGFFTWLWCLLWWWSFSVLLGIHMLMWIAHECLMKFERENFSEDGYFHLERCDF